MANSPLITAGICLALALSLCVLIAKTGEEKDLRADLTAARLEATALRQTLRLERDLSAKLTQIETTQQEAQADVKAAPDPECLNPAPLLDAWRTGIDRLRP